MVITEKSGLSAAWFCYLFYISLINHHEFAREGWCGSSKLCAKYQSISNPSVKQIEH